MVRNEARQAALAEIAKIGRFPAKICYQRKMHDGILGDPAAEGMVFGAVRIRRLIKQGAEIKRAELKLPQQISGIVEEISLLYHTTIPTLELEIPRSNATFKNISGYEIEALQRFCSARMSAHPLDLTSQNTSTTRATASTTTLCRG